MKIKQSLNLKKKQSHVRLRQQARRRQLETKVPKISEETLNIDMEQLKLLASRQIILKLVDRFLCALNHFYGEIRFGHVDISMSAGAQVAYRCSRCRSITSKHVFWSPDAQGDFPKPSF